MGNVAVFIWTGHLPSDEEIGADPATRYSADFGEQWAYQAAQRVAVAVLDAVRRQGLPIDTDVPYFGESAWHFVVRLGGQEYSVATLWVGRDGRNDSFAVWPAVRRGCLASLFGPRLEASAIGPVCAVLQAALAVHPQVADLEWVDVDRVWDEMAR